MENIKLYYIKLINSIFIAIITLFSIYFGKERSVFFDGADWLIEIIRNNNNYTPHYRFAVGINGILPWVSSYFTKDIHIILNAFIINYAITPVFFFFLIRYYFKSEEFVTIFLLGFCFLHLLVFFHPNHDAVTGYYYLLLFTAFLSLKNPNIENNYYFKIFVLSLLVALTHLTQYIFLIIITYYIYYYNNNKFLLKKVLCIVLFSLFLKLTILSSGYETGRYLETLSFFTKIDETFNSILVSTFYKSLIHYNIPLSILLILIFIKIVPNKQYKVFIIFILVPLLFILYFMSYFFGAWPHSFASEGYFKSAIIIPILMFVNFYIFNEKINTIVRYLLLISFYCSSIFLLYTHGQNYTKYYNNFAYVAEKIDKNTIFVHPEINMLEEFYIMHRHSTLINMIENNKCHYFHIINDTTNWVNNAYKQDTLAGGFCFKEKPIFKEPDSHIIRKINSQYNLINKFIF